MAIINFSAADALQTKVVEAVIYPCEITKFEGPVKSSSGKSYTFYVDFAIAEGPFAGKTRTLCFNSETKSPSVLGEMQYYPQAALLEVDAAISGRQIVPENYALDTEKLLHKKLDCKWGTSTNEGHLFNTIDGFFPLGYGKSAPGF